MKKKILGIVVASILSTNANAFGSRTEWMSGWAQGTTEYVVLGDGQSQLYISCDPSKAAFIQFTDPNGVSVSSLDNSQSVYAVIDGGETYLINEVESDAGSSNITVAWEALRKGKQVVVSSGNLVPATFTLKKAGKVLPKLSGSDCKVGWDIP